MKDAFSLDRHSTQQRVTQATELLKQRAAVVLLEDTVALTMTPTGSLLCEVIDPSPASHRCAEEFKVLIENASRLLDSSALAGLLPPVPRRWVVVEDQGTKVVQLWPE